MKNKYNQLLDKMEKTQKEALPFLDKQARFIEALDKRMANLDVLKAKIEAEKQAELEKMQDLMEAVPILTHILPNGYTIAYDHKRKLTVNNMTSFLRWLKTNCETSEVLSFFEGAIKSVNLKKFVEKKCDEQRAQGIMEPKVDGVDIGEITFRRLTTFYKENKK